MTTVDNIIENPYIQNILCGVIGGILVLVIQNWIDKKKKEKERIESSIVGMKHLKILSQDFLYQNEPGKITIEKLIEDFGQPQMKYYNNEYNNSTFEFKNAKLEVISNKENGSIIALTVFSKLDSKYPVNCRLSFDQEDEILGKAKISDSIIENEFHFESYRTNFGAQTLIGCSNAFRPSKYLKYYYQISGEFDNIAMTKGETIVQVCVSEVTGVYSFFSSQETF
ncbi:hypothetical protein [Chryseobacterium sp.]|uniref:hypothetical protein n=1 Tax=Chryseobacterium sp. TaxID=1871047 RepID=UPI00333F7746